jgi:hypothetical protein
MAEYFKCWFYPFVDDDYICRMDSLVWMTISAMYMLPGALSVGTATPE